MANSAKSSFPPPEVIQSHLEQLSAASLGLNQLSDALTKVVARIEIKLNSLNLGVEAYVPFATSSNERGASETWTLGYEKSVATRKWGFVIVYSYDDPDTIEPPEHETWAFKDAPRRERVRAVRKIPALLQVLEAKVREFASEITESYNTAQTIALHFGAVKPEEKE